MLDDDSGEKPLAWQTKVSVSAGSGAGQGANPQTDESAKKAGGKQPAEEKPVEKSSFDLVLQGYDPSDKVKIIKEVKTVLSLGLKEAKDLVDKLPATLAKGLSKKDAEELMEKLKPTGGRMVLV